MMGDMEGAHIGEDRLGSADIQDETGGPQVREVGRLDTMGRGQSSFGREITPIGEKALHQTTFT